MDTETGALVQRWIIAFCEPPVLIDADLMRRMLSDHDARSPTAVRTPRAGCRLTDG
ncbi:MAG: hypothetical protein PSV23_02610 [Brevundimonas sp.]|uniref:hypothetical protein n=1 Tax=Brevundimonas sp. TaxID=1871086 RepID=UPI0024879ED0|nr:hypothetical protein [Brevundimonas sp.]MDI1325669.1 hypothetical protein [Brevundimonas sp.]